MLLRLLEDKNGEVQNLAVRCLGPLVAKVKDYQVEVIVDSLCSNMVGDKEQLRDISSIGLKTVINELPLTTQSLAASVCKTMVCKGERAGAGSIKWRRLTSPSCFRWVASAPLLLSARTSRSSWRPWTSWEICSPGQTRSRVGK